MVQIRTRAVEVPATLYANDVELEAVDRLVVRMYALVANGITGATDALLGGDRALARTVVAADLDIDALQHELEAIVERRLVDERLRTPSEVRFLISVLRIAPELERSGDLIEHIAVRTPQRLIADVSPRTRGLLQGMGHAALALWLRAADVYVERDPAGLDELRQLDDQLDDLHVELTEELARGSMPVSVAIELGLIARFYERLGDHAVNVTGRIACGDDA
ncbi:MAG: PhoU domain-containing protein [Acidimicrobiales bacterium]